MASSVLCELLQSHPAGVPSIVATADCSVFDYATSVVIEVVSGSAPRSAYKDVGSVEESSDANAT